MPKLEPRELIRRCASRRDAHLWEQFVERFGRSLRAGVERALARHDVRASREDRQDLLQEVFCRLLEGRGDRLRRCRSRAERGVRAYLCKVAENVVIDYLRALGASKRGHSLLREAPAGGGLDPLGLAADKKSSPEDRLLLRERRRQFLRGCCEAVGADSRQRDLRVLYLALFEGWTSQEICDRLGDGLTPTAVDSLMYRLKRRLSQRGLHLPRRRASAESRSRARRGG